MPLSGFCCFFRTSDVSIPCATAFRSRCSNGGPNFSSTLRSISVDSPSITKSTALLSSRPVWRTTRCKRSEIYLNGSIRTFNNVCCKSRFIRSCCCKAASDCPKFLSMFCCTVATSFTLSAIIRVNSCKRVKRSNSNGSNISLASCNILNLDCICVSASISSSRK